MWGWKNRRNKNEDYLYYSFLHSTAVSYCACITVQWNAGKGNTDILHIDHLTVVSWKKFRNSMNISIAAAILDGSFLYNVIGMSAKPHLAGSSKATIALKTCMLALWYSYS